MAAWRKYRRSTVPWYMSLPSIWVSRLDPRLLPHDLSLRHAPSVLQGRARRDGAKPRERHHHVPRTVRHGGGLRRSGRGTSHGDRLGDLADLVPQPHAVAQGRARAARARRSTTNAPRSIRCGSTRARLRASRPGSKKSGSRACIPTSAAAIPDGDLAYVPLMWMVDELRQRLRFQTRSSTQLRAYQSAPLRPAHRFAQTACRCSTATARGRSADPIDAGRRWSIIHDRGRVACCIDHYAPVTLPASAKVLMPDGSLEKIKGYDAAAAWRNIQPIQNCAQQMEQAQKAVQHLNKPDPAIALAYARRHLAPSRRLFPAAVCRVPGCRRCRGW